GPPIVTTPFARPPSFAMTSDGSVASTFLPAGQQPLALSSVICSGFISGALPSNLTWPVALPSAGGVTAVGVVMAPTQLSAAAKVRIVLVFIGGSLLGLGDGVGFCRGATGPPSGPLGRPWPNLTARSGPPG